MQPRTSRVIEWVIVLCLVAIVASILVPSSSHWRGQTARRVHCMNNLREIGQACVMYAQDYGGYYPTVREQGTTSRPMASLALLYDKYISSGRTFTCQDTMGGCWDLQPGQTFLPHAMTEQEARQGESRRCSYAYDATRAPGTSPNIVIAGDAPPSDLSLKDATTKTTRNSDNHFGNGQLVLLYDGNTVLWITNTMNPKIPGDDIYSAADPKNAGVSDSYIHQ